MRPIRFLRRVNVREHPTITAKVLIQMQPGDTGQATGEVAFADSYEWHRVVGGWCARRADGYDLFEFTDGGTQRGLFDVAIEFTLFWEGGYVFNPKDPGGETKYGISKRAYPHLDIKKLTVEKAKEIYFKDYWLTAGCQRMTMPVALVTFDIGVISGVSRAVELHRKYDGDPVLMLSDQLLFYAQSKDFDDFGRGWVRRAADLLVWTRKK